MCKNEEEHKEEERGNYTESDKKDNWNYSKKICSAE